MSVEYLVEGRATAQCNTEASPWFTDAPRDRRYLASATLSAVNGFAKHV